MVGDSSGLIPSEKGPAPVAVVPLDPGADPAMIDAVRAVAPPRFCRTCGTAQDPASADCPGCRVQARRAESLGQVRGEQRAVKSAIGLYMTLLGVCAVGLLVGSLTRDSLDVEFGVGTSLSAVTFAWCVASWRDVLPLFRRTGHVVWAAAAVGLSAATFAVAMGVISGFRHFLRQHGAGGCDADSMSAPFLRAGWGWGMVVLCVCVQPAVVEELAFRGVILGAFRRALSPVEAVLVSAMMFMILHLSVARFPHTLALGLAAGYLRTRTRSLYPCMALHFCHNFLCVAAEWAGAS